MTSYLSFVLMETVDQEELQPFRSSFMARLTRSHLADANRPFVRATGRGAMLATWSSASP